MINIVMPMADEGSRFAKAGYVNPKPFIDVLGKPMIEHVIENLRYVDARYILIARKDHLQHNQQIIKMLTEKYNATFIGIDKLTEGTACTVLYTKDLIENDEPLLIANSDQIVDINICDCIDDCATRNLEGSILTFNDRELNPKWSFAATDENGMVTHVKEKEAISSDATVVIYLYSKGKDYVSATIQNDN